LILQGEMLERAIGIEPMTSSLGSWHSTAELRPPATDCPIAVEIFQALIRMTRTQWRRCLCRLHALG
jgi:hypothetical protein